MPSLEETFGSQGNSGPKHPWLNLPKEDGDSITFLFTGEQRWVNEYNPKTRKKTFMVKTKDEVTGRDKWSAYDEGSFDPEKFENFEPKQLVTVVQTDDGLVNLKWSYVDAMNKLKEQMGAHGLGTDAGVACKVTMVDRSAKPFEFSVELKEV